MKLFRLIVLLFTTCAAILPPIQSSGLAQTKENSEQNSPSQDNAIAERRYDPLAGHPHFRGGIWDNVLNGINPENKDLGASMRSWRQAIVAETIQNIVFWAASGFAASVLLALLFLEGLAP